MTRPRTAPAKNAPRDDAIAWELAATAHPHLTRAAADRIYIAIGVGETFAAIDALITAVARHHLPLGRVLIATVASWLDCYRGQDAEPRLRHLLGEIERFPPPTLLANTPRFGRAPQAVHDQRRQPG